MKRQERRAPGAGPGPAPPPAPPRASAGLGAPQPAFSRLPGPARRLRLRPAAGTRSSEQRRWPPRRRRGRTVPKMAPGAWGRNGAGQSRLPPGAGERGQGGARDPCTQAHGGRPGTWRARRARQGEGNPAAGRAAAGGPGQGRPRGSHRARVRLLGHPGLRAIRALPSPCPALPSTWMAVTGTQCPGRGGGGAALQVVTKPPAAPSPVTEFRGHCPQVLGNAPRTGLWLLVYCTFKPRTIQNRCRRTEAFITMNFCPEQMS